MVIFVYICGLLLTQIIFGYILGPWLAKNN